MSRSRKLPAAVVALGITSLLTDVASEMIFPLLPVFLASLGATPAFLGLVEGLADATSSLLKLGSGYVSDRRRNAKPLVVVGYGVAAIVRPLVALATAPWHVLAVRVTDRIGKGIRTSPRDVLIASSVPKEETGRAFGFQRAMDHTGAVVGPLIATALLGLGLKLRSVFWIALAPGMLSVVAVLTVKEPPRKVAHEKRAGTANTQRRLPSALRTYLAIICLFALGNSSDAFLLLRAKGLGVAVQSLPLLWSAFHVAKVVSSSLGGRWSDRIARPKLIVAGWIVYAATYLAFAFATTTWQVWALFVVYGVYYGLTEPVERALVKDLAPEVIRGRAYGFYNFIVGISAIPAGVLTGWLWQTFSPLAALSVGASLAGLSSVLLLVWNARTAAAAR